MKNVNATLKALLLAAMVIALMSVSVSCSTSSSLSTGAKSWKDETVLISRRGDQTVVRPLEGDKVLFKNADPQLAIEWGEYTKEVEIDVRDGGVKPEKKK